MTAVYLPYADRWGMGLDWSGVSGVYVCPRCGEQGGPYFSATDTASAAAHHRKQAHAGEAWEAQAKTCVACGVKPANAGRGMCRSCVTKEARELRRMEEEADV
jgi:NMD protein affecting ribosome stability and mRNA decay